MKRHHISSLNLGTMSLPPGVAADTCPGPVLAVSRQPSPAGVPGPSFPPVPVWRCCPRASSEVAWSVAGPGSPYLGSPGCRWGSQTQTCAQVAPCAWTPRSTRNCCPLLCSPRDSGTVPLPTTLTVLRSLRSAGGPFLLPLPSSGCSPIWGCNSPPEWPHILCPPQEACLCTHCRDTSLKAKHTS